MTDILFQPSVAVAIAMLFMVAAGVWESMTTRVPNALTFTALVNAFLYAIAKPIFTEPSAGGLTAMLLGMFAGGCLLLPLYRRFQLGAGCVKAAAAYGAWLGCGLSVAHTIAWLLASVFLGTLVLAVYSGVAILRKKDNVSGQFVSGQFPLSLGALAASTFIVWMVG